MRVLLTGAAGFVGQVALELLRRKHQVTALDIRPVTGGERTIQGDVLDYPLVEEAVAGHDAVVNTIMAPNPSYGPGGYGFTVNVSGMYNLLEAVRVHRIKRFVHTSSGAVHEGYPKGTFLANDLYPLKTSGAYSLSKLLQEELARNFHEQHGLSIAVVRPWGIIDADRMVDTDGRPVEGFHWGHIDRRDVASALACALEASGITYECFYLMATPGGYKIADVARTEQRLGWKPSYRFDADYDA